MTTGGSELESPRMVYIVTSGSYSDYHIERVFSTRALAEKFVNGAGPFNIEEYPLDVNLGQIVMKHYRVDLQLETGDFILYNRSLFYYEVNFTVDATSSGCLIAYHGVWHSQLQRFVACVTVMSPVSAEHAMKVAIEERQRWLREKGGAR